MTSDEARELAPHIVRDPARCGGWPVIDGTGLMPDFIGVLHERGVDKPQLMRVYALTAAQVDAACTFYAGMRWQGSGRRKWKRAAFAELAEKWPAPTPTEGGTDAK